jgi:hypothetical protein
MSARPQSRMVIFDRGRLRTTAVALALAMGVVGGTPTPAAAAGPEDHSHETVTQVNGALGPHDLAHVAGITLAHDAARAYAAMVTAASADGSRLVATGGYRTFDQQVELRARKGSWAAPPGTSMHGWGIAVDFDMQQTDFAWLRQHAAGFGWVHPAWAQPGGSKPEPWHWEYVGTDAGLPDPVPAMPALPEVDAGTLLGKARIERLEGQPGRWFEVLEGVDVEDPRGAGHYPGTALPAEPGNFAVAGYHQGPRAALRGLETLVAGDAVRVVSPEGEEHVYDIVRAERLGLDDGWAVGPDPLEDGSSGVMTLTTGVDDTALLVVWARLRACEAEQPDEAATDEVTTDETATDEVTTDTADLGIPCHRSSVPVITSPPTTPR